MGSRPPAEGGQEGEPRISAHRSIASHERIVTIPRPARRFSLLRSATTGDFVSFTARGFSLSPEASDEALFVALGSDPPRFRHHASQREVELPIRLAGEQADADVEEVHGPAHPPSEYLRQLREQGWACLPCLYSPEAVAAMRAEADRTDAARVRVNNNQVSTRPPLSAAVLRAAVEPVSLWVLRQYFGTPHLSAGAPPTIGALHPHGDSRAPPLQGAADTLSAAAAAAALHSDTQPQHSNSRHKR